MSSLRPSRNVSNLQLEGLRFNRAVDVSAGLVVVGAGGVVGVTTSLSNLSALSVTGDVYVGGTLGVSRLATFGGGISLGGSSPSVFSAGISAAGLTSSGPIIGLTNVGISGTLGVTGLATFRGGISVSGTGPSTFSGGISTSGLTVSGGLTVRGGTFVAVNGARVTGGIDVSGSSIYRRGLTVSGSSLTVLSGASISGGLAISGSATYSDGLTVSGSSLTVSSGANISSGGLIVSDGLTVVNGGISVRAGGLSVTGGIGVTNGLTVYSGGLSVSNATSLFGGLGVTNGLTVYNGGLSVRAGGVSVTGGLNVITGGMSVLAGRADFAGGISTSTIEISGLLTAVTGIDVTGTAIFNTGITGSTMYIRSGATINSGGLVISNGGLGVTGTAIFNTGITGSTMYIRSGATINSGGLVISTGGLGVTGTATFNTGITGSTMYIHSGATINSGGLVISTGGLGVTGGLVVTGLATLSSTDGNNVRISRTNDSSTQTHTNLDFHVSDTNHTVGRIQSFYNDSGLNGSGGLCFHTRQNGVLAERMRITRLGDVGIGTTAPSAKLDVSGSIAVTGLATLRGGLSVAGNISGSTSTLTIGSITGASFLTVGAASVTSGGIAVTGGITVTSGGLSVTGLATFSGGVTASGLTVSGPVTAQNGLRVMNGGLSVNGVGIFNTGITGPTLTLSASSGTALTITESGITQAILLGSLGQIGFGDFNATIQRHPPNSTNINGVTFQEGIQLKTLSGATRLVVGTTDVGVVNDLIIGGNARIARDLWIGSTGGGTTINTIRFYGTPNDVGSPPYTHTAIAERVYAGTEDSELLLFKGKDQSDKVRVVATGGFQVDIGTNTQGWNPGTMNTSPNVIFSNCINVNPINGFVGINKPSATCPLDVTGNARIAGNLIVTGTISGSFSVAFPVYNA